MDKVRVLVVEDNDLHAEKIIFCVEEIGYELIKIVDNADECLTLMAATKPDIVLLDIMIHGERNGVELAEEIRKRYDTPIIFISSLVGKEIIGKAIQTEPDAYLTKPIEITALSTAIELAIYKKNLNSEFDTSSFQWKEDLVTADSIFVKNRNCLEKVVLNDIQFVSVEQVNCCDIVTLDKTFTLRMSLNQVQKQFPQNQFVRISRSHIINLSKLSSINLKKMELVVGEFSLEIGKSYKKNLFQYLNTFS